MSFGFFTEPVAEELQVQPTRHKISLGRVSSLSLGFISFSRVPAPFLNRRKFYERRYVCKRGSKFKDYSGQVFSWLTARVVPILPMEAA
jgi:hypothetical protein